MVLTQNRYGDQCNKTKGPNMVHASHLVFDKDKKNTNGEKVSFTDGAGTAGYHQEKNIILLSLTLYEEQLQMD